MGFKWNVRQDWLDQKWDVFMEHLVDFAVEHGSCDVPQRYVCKDGYSLGINVNDVRTKQQYLKQNPERKEQLDQMGFKWIIKAEQNDSAWGRFWSHLSEFVRNSDSTHVPFTHVCEDGYKLGFNAYNCRRRQQYIKNNPKRQMQLESIGFGVAK